MATKRFHIILMLVLFFASVGSAEIQTSASYLYSLSDFNGPVSSIWARITVDPEKSEIYTLDRQDGAIRVFNTTAMQVYGFGENLRLASATDIAAGDNGEMFVLYRHPAATISHLDYRGEVLREIVVDTGNEKIADFSPEFIDFRNGKLFLADGSRMLVATVSLQGEIERFLDFRQKIAAAIKQKAVGKEINEAQRKKLREDMDKLSGAIFNGFHVGEQEDIYFTIASFFSAYRYQKSEQQLSAFGIPGSAPGKFGVVASIATDDRGNIFVSDRLRCVVLMFDRELQYQAEFGYRGPAPYNLVVPDDLAVDVRHRRIYVAQAANRGVSVFNVRTQ